MGTTKRNLFLGSVFALVLLLAYVVAWQANAKTELPVLYITIEEELVDKEYSQASMEVSYPNQVNLQEFTLSIRYRGNTTFFHEKKAYKIKLDEKSDLLTGASESSDNAAKDWILLANYYDKGGLRNYYTFLAASMLDGIEYVTENILVELYINGEYAGVYQLCEEVEVNEARLDIDDEAEGDNGILMEMKYIPKQEYFIGTYYGEDEVVLYDVRSQISDQSQLDRGTKIMYAMTEAILAGDQAAFEAVVDIDSCIDMYILSEFVIDVDVGYGSFYVYIKEDEDVVYFGPPWDFDRSIGLGAAQEWDIIYAASDVTQTRDCVNVLFRDLMEQEWFRQRVKERWNETKDVFLQALVETQQTEASYREYLENNYALWYAAEGQSQEDWQAAYDANYAEMYEWIENRYIWLDAYFNSCV